MKNSYLLDVIEVLQPKERQEFLVFLNSPYFNRGTQSNDLIVLFQAIIEQAPGFSEENLSKNRIYERVYPQKKMVEGKLEKLMAELNRLLRLFAVIQRQTSEDNEENIQLEWIKWLRERGVAGRFQQAISKYKTGLTIQKKESLERYRQLFFIAEEEHAWITTYNLLKGDLNIPQLSQQFDLFYLNYKSDLNIRLLMQQKAAKIPHDAMFGIFQELNGIASNTLEASSLLAMTQTFLSLIQKPLPSVADFEAMMLSLQSKESIFSFDTLSIYYSHLRNFCTLLIDEGHTELVHTLHQLSKSNLENGYFFTENKIRPNAYLSLVQIALRANDLDWAMEFTEKFKNRILGGNELQFYYRLNLASCLLVAGRFEEALDHIPDTAPSPFYHLLARRLELKAYYELKSDLLPYKIDAFRKFVERTAPKSVPTNLQIMNLNFIHILTQLYQTPFKDPKRSARLIARIQEKGIIGERAWLLEKARNLS